MECQSAMALAPRLSSSLQDLVRRNPSLVERKYYGERVAPCLELQDYLMVHPEVTFVTYNYKL